MRTLLAAGILVSTLGSALAQDYPSRPITLVVPFSAGGPTDTVARVTAAAMSKTLGQSIVIENVPGAGGTLGAGRVARAEPDGYSLLIHHVGLATAATLYRKLAYDTRTAFAPIGLTTDAPMIFVGRSNLEPNSLQELVAYARARGKDFMFASAGLGSASNLCGLMFMAAIKQKLSNVPYKGGGPPMTHVRQQVEIDDNAVRAATSRGSNGSVVPIRGAACSGVPKRFGMAELRSRAGLGNAHEKIYLALDARGTEWRASPRRRLTRSAWLPVRFDDHVGGEHVARLFPTNSTGGNT